MRLPTPAVQIFQTMVQRANYLAVGIALLVFLAGVVYTSWLGDQLRFLPDESDYLTLSANLAAQGRYTLDGIHPSAYRAPGFPLFLAVFQIIGLGTVGLRMLNFVLLAFSFWLLYHLLNKLHSPIAGLVGVFLAAGYLVLFYTAGTFYPQTLAGFLILGFLNLITSRGNKFWHFVVAGLLGGWLVLTVPTFIYIIPITAVWLVWARHTWKGAVWVTAVALLLVSVWSARNVVSMGGWVFVSTNSGENLLLGNSPETTANSGTLVDISSFRQQADALSLDELLRDRFYQQQAMQYILNNPGSALRLYVQKFLNFFNYRNNLATVSEASPARDVLMIVTYYPILILAALRIMSGSVGSRQPDAGLSSEELLFGSLYLTGALVQAVFFTRLRFRLPLDYLLIALASGWVASKIEPARIAHLRENRDEAA